MEHLTKKFRPIALCPQFTMCTFQVGSVDFEKVYFHGCNSHAIGQKLTYQLSDEDLSISSCSWSSNVLVIIANRLGDKQVDPCFLPSIRTFMKLPQFVGLIGGKPKAA